MDDPLRVGVVGLGRVSTAYLATLDRLPNVAVVAAADQQIDRAKAAAESYPGIRALAPDELYADAEIETVLNLTVPAAHAPVALAALRAGKHVYGEKPFAATRTDGAAVLEAAAETGLRIGCAPDTVLGTGIQTARAILDRGDAGQPAAATAFVAGPGPVRHADPEPFFQPGGGPLFDMGPYYLTTLVTLLGPVRQVVGRSSRARTTRVVGGGPRQGTTFPVEVDTHVTGVLEHHSGVLTTLVTSFDVQGTRLPRIEIYGAKRTIAVPNPNRFADDVEVYDPETREWTTAPVLAGYPDAARGYGLADLARAIRHGGPHRANAVLAYHVLDVMESLLESAAANTPVDVASTADRPAPVPARATPDQT